MRKPFPRLKLSALTVGLMLSAAPVQAELLSQILPGLMESDDEIKQVEAELEGAQHQIRIKQADWYPTVDLTFSEGYENQLKPDAADTHTQRSEYKVEVSQLITDFGATMAGVSKARLQYEKKTNDLRAKKQSITIDALTAYLDLIKNTEKLQYAKRSEGNIKKQTGMEEARVASGSGYSTDVLQSKSKLASAYAKTARAQGALVKSNNEFRAVFGNAPQNLRTFRRPVMPYRYLPKTLEEALAIAYRGNTTLIGANYDVEIARKDIKTAESKFMPTIEANIDSKVKRDDGGTMGHKNEFKAHVELSMPLYAGGKDLFGLKKSSVDLISKQEKLDKVKRDVEEKVRNAWQDLITDKTNAEFLRNSANISGEFLTLARKERKMGTRSLIDVLSEENSYINALDSAVSAETDLILSAFKLLKEIGRLDAAMVQDQMAAPAPTQQKRSSDESLPEKSAALEAASAAAAEYKADNPELVKEQPSEMDLVQEVAEVIEDSLNAVIRKMEGAREQQIFADDAVLDVVQEQESAPVVVAASAEVPNSENLTWDAAYREMQAAGWISAEE